MTTRVEPSVRTRILVREVMNSPVITCGPRATLKAVAKTMSDHRVGSVVVAESEAPVGIVTDGDIVFKAVSKDQRPSDVRAGEIMSKPLHTIDGGKDITDAARIMRKLGIKRLGVTYKGALVGIVSVSDLMAVTPELVELVSEKTRILTGEAVRRRGYLAGYCDNCNQWSDYLLEVDGKFLCDECRAEPVAES